MNKYQFLKYAVIGLTTFSRATSAYAAYSQDYRAEIACQVSQQVQQTLVDYGNQAWQQELSQQLPIATQFQDTSEGVLINEL